MDSKLILQGLIKYIIGLILVGLLIFIPAGKIYFNGLLFMCLLFIPMFIIGIILMIKDPELLRRRLNSKEKEKEQKVVVLLSGIMFISGFVVAGLNYRYNWINIPSIVVIISSIIFEISYILYFEVLRENTYLLRTIEVEENQKVVDKGLYSIVRHPMYIITIIWLLSDLFYLTIAIIFDLSIEEENDLLYNEFRNAISNVLNRPKRLIKIKNEIEEE